MEEGEGDLFVTTVWDRRDNYTRREYKQALVARMVQEIIGCPSTTAFFSTIDRKVIPNLPITQQDVANAENILGPSQAFLQCKTSSKGSDPVEHTPVHIPPERFQKIQHVPIVGVCSLSTPSPSS